MQTSLAHWRGYRSCGILGQVNSVYGTALLVQGAEALLSDRAVDARIKAARREFPDAELVELEGREVDAGRFVEATGGSLFSQATIVVVNAVSDLDKDLFDLVATTAANPREAPQHTTSRFVPDWLSRWRRQCRTRRSSDRRSPCLPNPGKPYDANLRTGLPG